MTDVPPTPPLVTTRTALAQVADFTACGVRLIVSDSHEPGTVRVEVYCELPVDHEGLHWAAVTFSGDGRALVAQGDGLAPLLASGYVVAVEDLAADDTLVERVVGHAYGPNKWPVTQEEAEDRFAEGTAWLRALAAALTDQAEEQARG
jgi:hypothetical protein